MGQKAAPEIPCASSTSENAQVQDEGTLCSPQKVGGRAKADLPLSCGLSLPQDCFLTGNQPPSDLGPVYWQNGKAQTSKATPVTVTYVGGPGTEEGSLFLETDLGLLKAFEFPQNSLLHLHFLLYPGSKPRSKTEVGICCYPNSQTI